MNTKTHSPLPWKAMSFDPMADKKTVSVPIIDNYAHEMAFFNSSKENVEFALHCVNNHYQLVEVVRAMANFDGRNNNNFLKEMARKAIAEASGE